jgi:hypothetical protein
MIAAPVSQPLLRALGIPHSAELGVEGLGQNSRVADLSGQLHR